MENKDVVKQRKTPHRWQKGECGNPNGRPRKPEIEILREALEKAQNKHGKHFIEHFVNKAYTNDQIAIALAKKLLPDQLQGKGFGNEAVNYFLNMQIEGKTLEELVTDANARLSAQFERKSVTQE
ncbi:MAG: DUF5681 domain-containing protein [Dehalococcoidales bacterium]|jgi:hypothetical protein